MLGSARWMDFSGEGPAPPPRGLGNLAMAGPGPARLAGDWIWGKAGLPSIRRWLPSVLSDQCKPIRACRRPTSLKWGRVETESGLTSAPQWRDGQP